MSERLTVTEGAARFVAGASESPAVPHPVEVFVPGVGRLWRALGPLLDLGLHATYSRLLGAALKAMCEQRSRTALDADKEYACGLLDGLSASEGITKPQAQRLHALINTVYADVRPATRDDH